MWKVYYSRVLGEEAESRATRVVESTKAAVHAAIHINLFVCAPRAGEHYGGTGIFASYIVSKLHAHKQRTVKRSPDSPHDCDVGGKSS